MGGATRRCSAPSSPPDGQYHNTPFAVQRGRAELAAYRQRVKLQQDLALRYRVLAATPGAGIAHWHATYRAASEELSAIRARATGTKLVARQPGAHRLHSARDFRFPSGLQRRG